MCFAVASVCCEDALELRLYFFVDPVFLRSRRDRGLPIVYSVQFLRIECGLAYLDDRPSLDA